MRHNLDMTTEELRLLYVVVANSPHADTLQHVIQSMERHLAIAKTARD